MLRGLIANGIRSATKIALTGVFKKLNPEAMHVPSIPLRRSFASGNWKEEEFSKGTEAQAIQAMREAAHSNVVLSVKEPSAAPTALVFHDPRFPSPKTPNAPENNTPEENKAHKGNSPPR